MSKKSFVFYFSVIALMICFFCLSCSMDIFGTKNANSLDLSVQTITTDIADNKTFTVTATTKDKNGNTRSSNIVWEFSTPEKVQILYSTADSISFSIIDSGKFVLSAYDVSNPNLKKAVIITATGTLKAIYVSENNIILDQKKTHSISITFNPVEPSNKDVIWTSSDTNVAQVVKISETEASISAGVPGTAIITVQSASNASISATCKVTVSDIVIPPTDPRYLRLSDSYIEFTSATGSKELTATIYDGNNDEANGIIQWTSSDPSIVSVQSIGKTVTVTPLAVGSATISAIVEGYENISGECRVSIGSNLQGLIITQVQNDTGTRSARALSSAPQVSGTFPIGQTVKYKVSYIPADTTQKGVSWTTSSDAVAISADGDYVTVVTKKTGNALVTATSTQKSDVSASASVAVYDQTVEPDNNISEIILNPNSLTLRKGEVSNIVASVYDQNGSVIKSDLIWSSSSSAISLDIDGNKARINAVSAGIADIKVTSLANPYVSSIASVMVLEEGEAVPDVPSKLIPNISSKTIVRNSTFDVVLSYLPDVVETGNITWSVEDGSIAEIITNSSFEATIKGLSAGTTRVVATSSLLPDYPVYITVKVINPEDVVARVSSVILSDDNLTLNPPFTTDQTGLTATSYDSSGNVIEDTYTWIIDKTNTLSGRVYNNTKQFILTPIKPGTATVTVQSKQNPNCMASATIDVRGGLNRIVLSPSPIKMSVGSNTSVTATLTPEDTVQKTISWTISGDAVQLTRDNVNPYRVYLKALTTGTATLKAASVEDPSLYELCQITVLDSSVPETSKVNSITLSQTTLSINPPITTPSILTATVYDPDGLVYPRGVTWEVEDPTIAELTTQDEKRVSIVAKKAGETKIIARSIADPSITESCILTVSGKITAIVPEKTYITLVNGSSQELKVSLKPSDTIETELVWTTIGTTDGSSQETPWVTLRPTASGCLITGIKEGETTVTVSSKARPEIKADIAVIVTAAPKAMATISISPTPVELSPSSNRVKVTATVKPIGDSVIDEDVVFSIDPASLVDTTIGGSNEIYLIPNGTAGEGTIYAYLPSYPHIEQAKARLFVGGQLRSLVASGAQSVAVNVGETASIGVEYNPTNTTETGIVWTSSNSAVARVNGGNAADAIVTGVSSGVATITATSAYYPEKKVEFTIVVKSIINEVAFTDQFDNKGLIFTTDTNTPLHLACSISPDIERKLVYKPKTSTFTMATLSAVDGTINDVVFTPDPEVAGTYEYNITYDNKVVDVLTINTAFKGISINTTREVFSGDYNQVQLKVSSESGEVSTEQITFKSSDESVATVSSTGLVKAKAPGEAIIYSEISGGMSLQTRIYVNVELPASFEEALRVTGYLPSGGDTVLPSQLDAITTLDLRNCPSTLAVDLSGITKLTNLTALYLNGIKLSSTTLNLYNSPKLKTVEANAIGIVSVQGVPKIIENFSATDNLLTSYGFLSSTNAKNINLSNNQISSYTDLTFGESINLSNNKLKTIRVNSGMIKKLDVSFNQISSVTINTKSLVELNLSSNDLRYLQGFLSSDKYLNAPNLEILNLSDNMLGVKASYDCSTCDKTYQSASSNTYGETEAQNQKQPLMSVNLNWMPKLKEVNLLNNHIRSGLNGSDKRASFIIQSENLAKVELRGNHIGSYYEIFNSLGSVSKLPAASSYNAYGMTINYDRGGCFYTSRSWYDYWTWFLQHKTGWNYAISHSYMY